MYFELNNPPKTRGRNDLLLDCHKMNIMAWILYQNINAKTYGAIFVRHEQGPDLRADYALIQRAQ